VCVCCDSQMRGEQFFYKSGFRGFHLANYGKEDRSS